MNPLMYIGSAPGFEYEKNHVESVIPKWILQSAIRTSLEFQYGLQTSSENRKRHLLFQLS